jgi:hypothetical protein
MVHNNIYSRKILTTSDKLRCAHSLQPGSGVAQSGAEISTLRPCKQASGLRYHQHKCVSTVPCKKKQKSHAFFHLV